MKPLIIDLFEQQTLAKKIADKCGYDIAHIECRNFPDGETYLKFDDKLNGRDIVILNSLDRPDPKVLPLLFAVETARELGAKRVGLCAPYLAYMRQDKRFKEGEGITSEYFAKLVSRYVDWLVTVDPHLHRHHNLSEIYSIPNTVIHASKNISSWIAKRVENPVLIGPDSESEQWVSKVAKNANAPYIILDKMRYGDQNVEVSVPNVESYIHHTPVLIDDIISTGHTMLETVQHLKVAKMKPPICIGVHAIFTGKSYEALSNSGVERIITCNTISHPSNQIDLSSILIDGITQQLKGL